MHQRIIEAPSQNKWLRGAGVKNSNPRDNGVEKLHCGSDPVMVGIWVFASAGLRTRNHVVDPPQISKLPQLPLAIPSEAARDIETMQNRGFESVGQRLQELNVCEVGKSKDLQID